MSGYMDLFLETGNPAFYMMAKQANEGADAALAPGGAGSRPENPAAKGEASL